MKKLLFLLVLVATPIIRCDDLADAIRESDVGKVQLLLEKPDQWKLPVGCYFAFAVEAVRLRRDAFSLGQTLDSCGRNPTSDYVLGAGFYRNGAKISLASFIASAFVPLICKGLSNGVVNTSLVIMLGSSLSLVYFLQKLSEKKLDYLEKRYKNAVTIYGLMYEALASLEKNTANHAFSN